MSMLSLLTVIFISLKAVGQIDWSWWLVLSPTFVEILLFILAIIAHVWVKANS